MGKHKSNERNENVVTEKTESVVGRPAGGCHDVPDASCAGICGRG